MWSSSRFLRCSFLRDSLNQSASLPQLGDMLRNRCFLAFVEQVAFVLHLPWAAHTHLDGSVLVVVGDHQLAGNKLVTLQMALGYMRADAEPCFSADEQLVRLEFVAGPRVYLDG